MNASWPVTVLRGGGGLPAILAVFVVLGAAHTLASPIFEKPDEPWHFAYIRSLADGRGLPQAPIVIADDSPAQESSQPPLYYLTAAIIVRWVAPDASDWGRWLERNPAFPFIAEETRNDNKNVFVHVEPVTLSGTPLAVYAARGLALLFGALAIVATYGLGREVFPDRPAIAFGAAAFVAFLPQFVFISSAVSNDSATVATCAIALWVTTRIVRRGLTAKGAIGLGAALALAALSKVNAVALIPLSLLVVWFSLRGEWRRRMGLLALSVVPIAILAGPWYVRSFVVFGDALGTSTHLSMPWVYSQPLSWPATLAQVPGAIISFWLAFGWGNVLAPDGVYVALSIQAVIGLAASIRLTDSNRRWLVGLLAAWLAISVGALLLWARVLNAPLGRLVFPALPALGVLLASGWSSIARNRSSRLPAVLPVVLLGLNVVSIPAILAPAYARPELLTTGQVEHAPGRPTDVRFGDVARLIRIDVPRDVWPRPGDEPPVVLCWEALSADPRRLMALVQLVGAENRVIATRRTLPGLGSFPTGMWQPGDRFCDQVHVPIPDGAPAPEVVYVEVAMIDYDAQTRLAAFAPDGTRLEATFLDRTKIAPMTYAQGPIDNALDIRFGDQIALAGYSVESRHVSPGQAIRFRLFWRALRRPDADYTVFVHLNDATGRALAQGDGQPQSGAYPTSFWDDGEIVIDDRVVAVPPDAVPGEVTIVVGLYEWPGGDRLWIDGARSEFALAQVAVR